MVPQAAHLLLPILTLSSSVHSFNVPDRAAVKPPSTALYDYRTKWSPKGAGSSPSPPSPAGGDGPVGGGAAVPIPFSPPGKWSRTKWTPGSAVSSSPMAGYAPGGGGGAAAPADEVAAAPSSEGRQPWEDTNASFTPGKFARTKWSPGAAVSSSPMGGYAPGGGGGGGASGGIAATAGAAPSSPGKWSRTKWSPGSAVSTSPMGGYTPGGGGGGGGDVAPAAPVAPMATAPASSGRQPWEDTNTRKIASPPKSYARTKWSPGTKVSPAFGGFTPGAGGGVSSSSAAAPSAGTAASSPASYAKTKWSPGKPAKSSSPLGGYMPPAPPDNYDISHPTSVSSVPLEKARLVLSSKEFQLEELEDVEECETELWLNGDGTVTLGSTNGPRVGSYQGDWHVLETADEEDRPFRMRLKRRYEHEKNEAGSPYQHPNDKGHELSDATYEVKREFWGSIEMVGNSVSVSGKIVASLNLDSSNVYADDQMSEIGYFTLIDAAASEGVEGER